MGELKRAPWHFPETQVAFASESVCHFLYGGDRPMGRAEIQRRFRGQFGVAFIGELPSHADRSKREQLLAALLHKVAHRGLPALASINVERATLEAAARTGLLSYREDFSSSGMRFRITDAHPSLRAWLEVCFRRELLLTREEAGAVVAQYGSLFDSEPERQFFQDVLHAVGDPRLALFITPQRTFSSLGVAGDGWTQGLNRVDFAIDLPRPANGSGTRLLIELDDSHRGATLAQDKARDRATAAAGWETLRVLSADRAAWKAAVARIAAAVHASQLALLATADEEIARLGVEKRQALQGLIEIPIAEAHLLRLAAARIASGGTLSIAVNDCQGVGIGPAVEAVNSLVGAFARLVGSDSPVLFSIETVEDAAGLDYLPKPSASAWNVSPRGRALLAAVPCRARKAESLWAAQPLALTSVHNHVDDLKLLLQTIFRKSDFRPCQVDVIARAVARQPVIGLMPTGSGKSLCYQMASFLAPGATIVVEPIKSLIADQAQNLADTGIHSVVTLSSDDNVGDIGRNTRLRKLDWVRGAQRAFILVAPERLQIPEFRNAVSAHLERTPISIATIDEAHCVSEWGHSFRTAYLNLGRHFRSRFVYAGTAPAMIALTGTASTNVLHDVMRELKLDGPAFRESVVRPSEFDRKNLKFEIQKVRGDNERWAALQKYVERGAESLSGTANGLVFSNYARGKDGVASIVQRLNNSKVLQKFELGHYASTPQQTLDQADKVAFMRDNREMQQRFKEGSVKVLACTSAFGMGIDKPDVSFTAHAFLPSSIEDFYQQAGRAGRNGEPARCVLLFEDVHEEKALDLLDPGKTGLSKLYENRRYISDALRNLYFFKSGFKGEAVERNVAEALIARLFANPAVREAEVHVSDVPQDVIQLGKEEAQHLLEKGLHRLTVVGAIADYEVDYARNAFRVRLSRATSEDVSSRTKRWLGQYLTRREIGTRVEPTESLLATVRLCTNELIRVVYDRISGQRRRQMQIMLKAAREGASEGEAAFRNRINRYMEVSDFAWGVAGLGREDVDKWLDLFNRAIDPDLRPEEIANHLEKLEGACERQLTEDPDHPGLLLLIWLAATFRDGVVAPNFDSAVLAIKGAIADSDRLRLYTRLFADVQAAGLNQAADVAIETVALLDGDLEVLRLCYRNAQPFGRAHHASVMDLVLRLGKDIHVD